MSDIVSKLIKDQERIRKLTEPYGNLSKHLIPTSGVFQQLAAGSKVANLMAEQNSHAKMMSDIHGGSGISRMMKDLKKHKSLLEGPIAEARRIGLLDHESDLMKSIAAISKTNSLRDKMFGLPKLTELTGFAAQASEASKLAKMFASDMDRTRSLGSAIQRMTQPWMHLEHAGRSMSGIADLLALGNGLSRFKPFDTSLVENLRPSLGDWRDHVEFPQIALVDPITRIELYRDQGVDEILTDFPVSAFHEGVIIAGLAIENDDELPDQAGDGTEEDFGFERAEKAFSELRRFERAVRKFIEEVMVDAFGEHWIKRQLPQNMREKWEDKRQSDIDAGNTGQPLIEYADFSDYRMIIERADNWKGVFKYVFQRPEDIRESLQRLNPVRIATMHSRIVTMEDELLLMVETKRVLKAISTRSI